MLPMRYGLPLDSACPCLTALRTALPRARPPAIAAPPTPEAIAAACAPILAPAKSVLIPYPPVPPADTPQMDATAAGTFPITTKRITKSTSAAARLPTSAPQPVCCAAAYKEFMMFSPIEASKSVTNCFVPTPSRCLKYDTERSRAHSVAPKPKKIRPAESIIHVSQLEVASQGRI